MSADNGVYILETKDGYRVAHAQAIENIDYKCKEGEWNEDDIFYIFGKSKAYKTAKGALNRAAEIYDNIVNDEFCPICEYGIVSIFKFKDKEFPKQKGVNRGS